MVEVTQELTRGRPVPDGRRELAHTSPLALLRRVRHAVALWRTRSRQREALAALGERDLRDIGLSRLDAWREGRKWFWQG
jgi:uncharacterized protein YjiS (DUF1127 family)